MRKNKCPGAFRSGDTDGGVPGSLLYMLLLGLVALAALWLAVYYGVVADMAGGRVCPLYRLTGVPCPSCGGSRAFAALFAGDIAGSWRLNPNALLAVAAGVGVMVLLIADGLRLGLCGGRGMWLTRIYRGVAGLRHAPARVWVRIAVCCLLFLAFEGWVWWRNMAAGI